MKILDRRLLTPIFTLLFVGQSQSQYHRVLQTHTIFGNAPREEYQAVMKEVQQAPHHQINDHQKAFLMHWINELAHTNDPYFRIASGYHTPPHLEHSDPRGIKDFLSNLDSISSPLREKLLGQLGEFTREHGFNPAKWEML